jgi:mRNA interferase RelE/StbE
MPADIAENYEKIEDAYWARRAEEARQRLATGEDEVISYDQRPPGCRKLAGQEGWRIRVGDYRVVYEIHDQVLLVIVIDAGHRSGVHR